MLRLCFHVASETSSIAVHFLSAQLLLHVGTHQTTFPPPEKALIAPTLVSLRQLRALNACQAAGRSETVSWCVSALRHLKSAALTSETKVGRLLCASQLAARALRPYRLYLCTVLTSWHSHAQGHTAKERLPADRRSSWPMAGDAYEEWVKAHGGTRVIRKILVANNGCA